MKRNYWPVFFIGIFSFTFAMIVWTIISTSKANIQEDESFFKTYQEVDVEFNNMMNSNNKFLALYDLELKLNSKIFKLTTKDIMYSQRVLEKKSKHKNILNVGDNTLLIHAVNKITNEKKDIKIHLKVTKSNSNLKNVILTNKDFNIENYSYKTVFKIDEENNWNITGSFEIDGNPGYIYIKTNAS